MHLTEAMTTTKKKPPVKKEKLDRRGVLVIGGGIAGIQAALDLAHAKERRIQMVHYRTVDLYTSTR